MSLKICYLAAIDRRKDVGVVTKIESTMQALTRKGYQCEIFWGTEDGWRGVMQLREKLLRLDADLIILRGCGYYSLILVTALMAARKKGAKVVIDIPTPVANGLFEIWGQRTCLGGALMRMILLVLSLPWSHWVAHRIIQYGREHPWFMLGLKDKTVLAGNGFDTQAVCVKNHAAYSGDELVLIGVAKLFFWHGFDRVIKGIAAYEADRQASLHSGPIVVFRIVGDGPEKAKLEALVDEVAVTDYVHFNGFQVGDKLIELFVSSHVGVSPLGCHRKNLTLASPLKTREYLAMGLPVIFSYTDVDIDEGAAFVFKAAADDSPLSIPDMLTWYAGLRKNGFTPSHAHEFARHYLDFSVKTWVYEELLNPQETNPNKPKPDRLIG
ncbi:glycosyltransferase [Methylotuvimicrobium buryatense]|uniref:Glycosyltransferase n=1 Tax=Methylotuvimicrobium buryatense TaxID=95641 RepID=A0A4P9UKC6_METBY|nr:glycosyltransferase [Methylotuvimicrobium buryatense]QCW81578.1 glycosyltransferase [Methylotuvimicrobium buryatense]